MIDMEVLRTELWNSMLTFQKEAKKDDKGYSALIDAAVAITLHEVIKALDKADK
jgi:hypothetical protein